MPRLRIEYWSSSDGRIAQAGDHHALMAEGGLYKRLYEAQNVDPGLVYPTR